MCGTTKATCDKPHYENETPFEVPTSWTWCTVNEINMYNSKNVDPTKQKENTFELYSVPVFSTNNPEIQKGEKIGSAKQGVENGDVLLCKINPKINRVWFVKNRTENTMIASSEWIVVRNKFMLTDYLVFCFMSPYFRDLIENNVSGVGGSLTRAQPSMVATYAIPIPPFHEQERIVAEINHWFELIDVIEQSKDDLQGTIRKAKSKILDLAIHGKLVPQDPTDEPATELLKRINSKAEITCDNAQYGKLPNGWCMTNIESLFEAVSAKRVLKSEWKNKGIPFYRAREIVQLSKEGFANKDLFVSEEHYAELKEKYGVPICDDIMISAVGSIGYTYIVKKKDVFYYKDASVICLKNINHWNPTFFTIWLASPFLQEQMYKNSKGTTVATITLEKLKGYAIPLPPLQEQHRIAVKIEELFSQLDNIASSL